MAIINKTGIGEGNLIESEHITRIIDALSGVSTDTIVVTGSFSGSLAGTLTGALTGTASFATSASRAVSSSFATTASFALNAGGGGVVEVPLQFTHAAWVTSSTTPVYYGNYGALAPITTIAKMGVASPFTGTLVSASISAHMENPSGTDKLNFWAVSDGGGSPVSKSISTGAIVTSDNFSTHTYVLNPSDPSPFTVTFGDQLSIKMAGASTINGLRANTTVTLVFRV